MRTAFTVPITKIDKEHWLVTGVATAEVIDKQGELVDYASAKKFFESEALWPGNIREMHQPKAVGKRVGVEFDDANKVITLTARVSRGAPDTWQKVLDGTLSMYSIGGDADKVTETKDGAIYKRCLMKQLAEVSLVDNGANPLSKFEVVKSVNGALVDAQPADPEPEPIQKAAALLEVEKAAKKGPGSDDDASEHNKTATGQVGTYYAGTDGKSFPIKTPQDVKNAAKALGRTKQNRGKVKANIIDAAKKLGDKHVAALPDAWKSDDQKKAAAVEAGNVVKSSQFVTLMRAALQKSGMEPWDIDGALAAIGHIERLISNEYWDARQAATKDGNADGPEVAQVKLLKQAATLVMQFLTSEFEEQFADEDETQPSSLVPLGLNDDDASDTVVEMFARTLNVIKAGARHSKADLDLIQKAHDAMSDLGASCQGKDGDVTKVQKVAAKKKDCPTCDGTGKIRAGKVTCPDCDGSGEVPAGSDTEKVMKLTMALETASADSAATKATVAEQAKTIAALNERLEKVEKTPVGGGPVRGARVERDNLTGPGSTEVEGRADAIAKQIERVVRDGSEADREVLAMAVLKLQRDSGLGGLINPMGPR